MKRTSKELQTTPRQLPISAALTLLVLLTTGVFAILVGGWVLVRDASVLQQQHELIADRELDVRRDALLTFIDDRLAVLRDYAAFPLLSQTVMQPEALRADLVDFMDPLLLLGQRQQLVLLDFEGRIIYATRSDPPFGLDGNFDLEDVLEMGAQKYVDVVQEDGRLYWHLAVPVMHHDVTEGALLTRIPLDDAPLDPVADDKESGRSLQLMRYGSLLANYGHAEVGSQHQLPLIEAVGLELHYRVDSSDTRARQLGGVLEMIGISLALLITIVPIAAQIARRAIALPLEDLRSRTSHLAVGKIYETLPETQRIREVHRLAADFNAMAKKVRKRETSLREIQGELGKRVNRRTRELGKRQRELERRQAELRTINAELERSQHAAEAANTAKSAFLATMSHEIRTPMTAVAGYADLLMRSAHELPDRCVDWVKRIGLNTEHLVSLIGDILDLSKIEAGQMVLELEPCDPVLAIESVVSVMEVAAQEKMIALNVEYVGRAPETLHADSLRLRQILLNLVGNAVKFTDEGEVRICVREVSGTQFEGRELAFEISDTGIGIKEDQLDEIFAPFTQVHPVHHSERGGTGLGLNISRRLAWLQGGEISAMSEFGMGSTFTLRLPVRDDAEWLSAETRLSKKTADRGEERKQSIRGARVLVADDNSDNREIVAFLLQDMHAEVDMACDGAEALRAVLSGRRSGCEYDLVLMDMRMPVMDGYTATRELRAAGVETSIVALTAHAMSEDVAKCQEAGCDAYLAKPIIPSLFRSAVLHHVRRRVDVDRAASIDEPRRSEARDEPGGIESDLSDDPRFAPILRRYIESLPDSIESLEDAWSARDSEKLRAELHMLAGTGTSYGFEEITVEARHCEGMIRRGEELTELDAPLAALLDRLRAIVSG